MIVQPFAWFAKNGVPKEEFELYHGTCTPHQDGDSAEETTLPVGRSMCGGTLHRPVLGRLVFTVLCVY